MTQPLTCLLVSPPERQVVKDNKKWMGQEGQFQPLGISYIASVLRHRGIAVNILDARSLHLTIEETAQKVAEQKPAFCGINVVTAQYRTVLMLVERIKALCPQTRVILGGPHIHYEHLKAIQKPEVDFVVRGEGEFAALELLQVVTGGGDLRQVQGLTFRDAKGQTVVNPDREFCRNLDDIPFPARDLLPMEIYNAPISLGGGKPFTSMLATRGCPFKCHYCSETAMWGHQRRRSVDNILDEMEQVIADFGVKYISFVDDLLLVNQKWAIELCRGMRQRGIRVDWECTGRIPYMTEELLREMKKSNCKCVIFGIEFGSQRLLDLVERGYSIKQVEENIALTNKVGIPAKGLFMMGYPTETREDVEATIALAKRLPLDYVTASVVVPLPGTKLYEFAVEKGLLQPTNWEEHDVLQLQNEMIRLEDLTLEEVLDYSMELYNQVLLQPSYILRMLKNHPLKSLRYGPQLVRSALAGRRR